MPRLFTLLLAALLAACAPAPDPPTVDLEPRPDQETWDVVLALEMSEQPRLRLRAPYAARHAETDSLVTRFGPDPDGGQSERVRVEVFEDGRPSAVVTADRIAYYEEHRFFRAEGQVVVETESGRRLEGERVTWDEGAGELRSPGFVRITTPTERIQGYGLVSDENLDFYRLGRITGQVEVEDR